MPASKQNTPINMVSYPSVRKKQGGVTRIHVVSIKSDIGKSVSSTSNQVKSISFI